MKFFGIQKILVLHVRIFTFICPSIKSYLLDDSNFVLSVLSQIEVVRCICKRRMLELSIHIHACICVCVIFSVIKLITCNYLNSQLLNLNPLKIQTYKLIIIIIRTNSAFPVERLRYKTISISPNITLNLYARMIS